jgi:glycosyltransferase involved in cell wall biosynthesis
MRIVWDVSPLSHPRTGVGNYVRGTLAGLVEAAGAEHEVVAWAPVSARGKGLVEEALARVGAQQELQELPFAHAWRQAWSRLKWPPVEYFAGRLDVFHYSDWMFPRQRTGLRATTVHDLVPLRFPAWTHRRTVRMHAAKYRNAARTCGLIVCNSRFTAGEVVDLLGVPEERTRVAYPAAEDVFSPHGEAATLGERPYVLTVATLEPRKNLETLLAAHELVRDELDLAVVGAAGWGRQPQLDRPGVVPLGYVSDAELARLYRGAAAFGYPSRFEGFGIPVLEAMASGTPAVVSAHASLDEAAGEAVLRADPDDAEAWADALRAAVARRDELRTAGFAQAARFTWRGAGEAILAAYEELVP